MPRPGAMAMPKGERRPSADNWRMMRVKLSQTEVDERNEYNLARAAVAREKLAGHPMLERVGISIEDLEDNDFPLVRAMWRVRVLPHRCPLSLCAATHEGEIGVRHYQDSKGASAWVLHGDDDDDETSVFITKRHVVQLITDLQEVLKAMG